MRKVIAIEVSDSIYAKLEAVSTITGVPIEKLAHKAICGIPSHYMEPGKDTVTYKRGLITDDRGEKRECFVLYEKSIYKYPYYQVYIGGNIKSVPAEKVEVIE